MGAGGRESQIPKRDVCTLIIEVLNIVHCILYIGCYTLLYIYIYINILDVTRYNIYIYIYI